MPVFFKAMKENQLACMKNLIIAVIERWYFVSKIVRWYFVLKIVQVIEKNAANSRLKNDN